MTNPLAGWLLDRSEVHYRGEGLVRSECIVASRDGNLWAGDGRGGIMQIAPDGKQRLIAPLVVNESAISDHALLGNSGAHVPNGFAMVGDRFVFADIAGGAIVEMDYAGQVRVILDRIDGAPLGSVNFVLADRLGRLWISVSSRQIPADKALNPGTADGFIVLMDGNGARIVADGFAFTNELRLDAREQWLYVVESAGKRISRLQVGKDGSLGDREIFGPATIGTGFPDGIAFDLYGNLWCAMIVSERLIAITPDGDVLTLFDDGDPNAIARAEKAFGHGSIPTETSLACAGQLGRLMTSVTFSGPDLRTVHIGSLLGDRIPTFRSPVPGLPMAHW